MSKCKSRDRAERRYEFLIECARKQFDDMEDEFQKFLKCRPPGTPEPNATSIRLARIAFNAGYTLGKESRDEHTH